MKYFSLFTLCLLFASSCTSSYKEKVTANKDKVIFKEDFNRLDLSNLKKRFFVLSGNFSPQPLGERNALRSTFNANVENALLFGPKDLMNYSLETSFFFSSAADGTVAAGLGGGGQAGFKIQVYPTGDFKGIFRLLYEGYNIGSTEIDIKPNTWYRIRLDVYEQPDGKTRVQSLVYKEGTALGSWIIDESFTDVDFRDQVSVLTYPRVGFPVYVDDITIRSND